MIAKYGRRPTDFDTVVLARACEQFTGAEIEAVFIDALHEAFAEGAEPSERKHILPAMTNTVPLAQLMDGQISALRHWARGRARARPDPPPPRAADLPAAATVAGSIRGPTDTSAPPRSLPAVSPQPASPAEAG